MIQRICRLHTDEEEAPEKKHRKFSEYNGYGFITEKDSWRKYLFPWQKLCRTRQKRTKRLLKKIKSPKGFSAVNIEPVKYFFAV
jgi:hypothetical protein